MYAWKCNKCQHEWLATVNSGSICEWCGEDGVCLGGDVSYPQPRRVSDLFNKLTGGGIKDI